MTLISESEPVYHHDGGGNANATAAPQPRPDLPVRLVDDELTPGMHFRSEIEGKNGQRFDLDFYILDIPLGKLPEDSPLRRVASEVERVAFDTYTHWIDVAQEDFANRILPNTKALSVIQTKEGGVVGFNLFSMGEVEVGEGENASFMYVKYSGIDPATDEHGKPRYRNNGLFERARKANILTVNPDVVAACSAVAEIMMAAQRVSDETGRVMYPQESTVPEPIGRLGQDVYAAVYGEGIRDSVDTTTLVRHGKSAYPRGLAKHPLIDNRLAENDGLIYVSLTKPLDARLKQQAA